MRKHLSKFIALLLLLSWSVTMLMPQPAAASQPWIQSLSGIAIDYDTGKVLYSKDPATPRSVASMTKVMTSFLVYEAIAEGKLTMDTQIPITPDARALIPNDPCGHYVSYAQSESVRDLLTVYLVVSSSPAGTALANYLGGSVPEFVNMMNAKAKELGIDAYYNDPNGLMPGKVSAEAEALLVREFIKRYPDVLNITRMKECTFSGRVYPGNNYFYRTHPFPGVDGFKSGSMPFAGYCFASTAKQKGNRVIAVTINAADFYQRFVDGQAILGYAFSQYPLVFNTAEWAKDIPAQVDAAGINTVTLQGGSEFAGSQPISRAEFAAMLALGLRLPEAESDAPFTDINQDNPFDQLVSAAYAAGMVNGTSATTFTPDSYISRQEMAAMIDKGLKLPQAERQNTFADAAAVNPIFNSAIANVSDLKLMVGDDKSRFMPRKETSRQEGAAIVLRIMAGIADGSIKNPVEAKSTEETEVAEVAEVTEGTEDTELCEGCEAEEKAPQDSDLNAENEASEEKDATDMSATAEDPDAIIYHAPSAN